LYLPSTSPHHQNRGCGLPARHRSSPRLGMLLSLMLLF
jgi:hypothetical protein